MSEAFVLRFYESIQVQSLDKDEFSCEFAKKKLQIETKFKTKSETKKKLNT